MPAGRTEPLARSALIAIALATLLLQLVAITGYGYFRDELYYLASTRHLDWGYVEHPPLSIAVLALVRALFGSSLPALRIVPALAGAVTVFLTGSIARRLGGGGFAQGVAALAAALAPVFLGTCHYYSMNALELLLWTVTVWMLIGVLETGSPRGWIGIGVAIGLGLLNKISMLWLAGGIGAGLLLTPHRRQLATPWPWLAFAIAALMFVPHVLWQAGHGWPTLEFMRNATARKMVAVAPTDFLLHQVLDMSPGSAPLWLSGLGFGLFARAGRRGQPLVWIYLSVFALLILGGRSRASYLAPAYPMLLALGGVAIERWTARAGGAWLRGVVVGLVVALGGLAVPMALPVLPVETFIRYQRALGTAPRTEERQVVGPLPQQYADMFGWEELDVEVAKACERLTPEERRHARVFGQNYGEAGAIDVLGRKYGLPEALSGHNSYWLWGPGDWDGSVLIIIGGDPADNAAWFDSVEIVGRTESRYAMPYERGRNISIGRHLKRPVREVWPLLKMYI